MDKLTMAHEMAVAMQSAEPMINMNLLASLCFQYADAMQAEADKRLNADVGTTDAGEWQPDWSVAPDGATHIFKYDESN